MKFTTIADDAWIALSGLADYAGDLVSPTVRLGVTGLSRAGKTVFITALVHNLINGGRLPMFGPYAAGRITRAYLQPQPDDDVPRFDYEGHIDALTGGEKREWPQSTRRVSQLRITLEYEPQSFVGRLVSARKLNIDVVDYPGEWLLDLPLLDTSYQQWSADAISLAQTEPRDALASQWLETINKIDPHAPEDEQKVMEVSRTFTEYLRECRGSQFALSTVPPGRFLMPGDMDGSPLVSFAPLKFEKGDSFANGTIGAMMTRRYEAYVAKVVKPFFLNHFSKIDRQIVLVDLLSALNAGPSAVADVKRAMTDILNCFRPGKTSWLSAILGKRVDRIVFAATKADQLNHLDHDQLENILSVIVSDAINRAQVKGAEHDVVALASVRATREHKIRQDGEELPAIVGTPKKGETLLGKTYNGEEEIALFPGDLPQNPRAALNDDALTGALKFLKFRPPTIGKDGAIARGLSFPHIRLDKALNFLIGDKFQ